MKLRFNPKTIDAVEKDIKARVQKITQDKTLLSEVGEVIIKDIKFQTRRGVSTVTGDRFKPLTEEWRRRRARIETATNTHDTYSRNRSNLTITGQLLDSINKSIIGRTLKIFFEGIHKPYSAKYMESFKRKGKTVITNRSGVYKIGESTSNANIAEYVKEQGRPFFSVREAILPRLKTIVIRYIRRNL